MPVCRYLYPQEGMHRLHNSIASINNDYLFTAGRLQEATRFHQSGLVGGIREGFFFGYQPVELSSDKSFPTF